VGAGRPVQRSQDALSGGTSSDSSKDGSQPQSVQITGTARQLADLDQQVRNLPDVNEERVSQLRTAIEQGMSLEQALGSLPDAKSGASEK
jgi:flagellar biosynthesis anti-sigma factor FlgM